MSRQNITPDRLISSLEQMHGAVDAKSLIPILNNAGSKAVLKALQAEPSHVAKEAVHMALELENSILKAGIRRKYMAARKRRQSEFIQQRWRIEL